MKKRKLERAEDAARRGSSPEFAFWIFFLRSCFPERSSRFRLFDLANESFEIRPFAGFEFGMEKLAIGADFEGAAARWNQSKRRDPIAEVENFSRQTDGLGGVVSNAAILDSDFGFHRSLLSSDEINGMRTRVKMPLRSPLDVARSERPGWWPL